MESASVSPSPSFPPLDPIVLDDDMGNTYRDSDMGFLDPTRLSMATTNAGQDFDDLFAHAAPSRTAPGSESSHMSPSEMPGKHQYDSHSELKQPHTLTSDSPAESPDNSSRSSLSESPLSHCRNPSVASSSSAVYSENSSMSFQFLPENWINPELQPVQEEPLFEANSTMHFESDFATTTTFEMTDKAMDAAFDFESAGSSPSNLKSCSTPHLKPKPGHRPKLRGTSGCSRRSAGKNLFMPSGLPFVTHGFDQNPPALPQSNLLAQVGPTANRWGLQSPSSMLEEGFGGTKADGGSPLGRALPSNFNFAPDLPFSMDLSSPEPRNGLKSENSQHYMLTVHPTSVKSRVETQIPIKLTLYPLPAGITKLRLPGHTISKYKFLAPPSTGPAANTLELRTSLVCTSAMLDEEKLKRAFARARDGSILPSSASDLTTDRPMEETKPLEGGEVKICSGCIHRERKRASRKKQRKPEEDELFQKYESQRVIVFNTNEIKEWDKPPKTGRLGHGYATSPTAPAGTMQVELPMRIACYCRHQNEKLGFQVIFTIVDHMQNVVAQAISNSIMITDDHKTHGAAIPPALGPSSALPDGIPPPDIGEFSSAQSLPNLSRQASPSELPGPVSKRRKRSGSGRLPLELTMTRAEPQPPNVSSYVPGANCISQPPTPSRYISPAERPFVIASAIHNQLAEGPPTPTGNENSPFFSPTTQNLNLDSISQQQLMSAPSSSHPSRPGTPGEPNRSGLQDQSLNLTVGPNAAPQMWPLTGTGNGLPSVIHKVVPAEGSIAGGTEVTLLGSGFYPGMEIVFGDTLATTTTFWGDKCLNCLTPPALQPGLVIVVFKHEHPVFGQLSQTRPLIPKQQQLFRYVDDRELQMYRLALGILGHKLGNQADAFQTAQQIMGGDPKALMNMQKDIHSGSGGNQRQVPGLDSQSKTSDLDAKMLTFLEFIDLDNSPRLPRYNSRCTTGQTLLHFASSMGLTRFVAGLLARGANPDVQDNTGNTPMHLAALSGHAHIVRKLRFAGADPNTRSIRGFMPADLGTTLAAHQAALLPSRNSRSRSVGSLASLRRRQSSSASLDSHWETFSDSGSTGRSADDIYDTSNGSTDDESDSDIQEPGQILTVSRQSGTRRTGSRSPNGQLEAPEAARSFSPPAALIAWRNHLAAQVNQFQQSVANAFPNLPALPPMPALPDYQAYPMMRRITNLVPHRPTAHWPVRDGWWELLKGNSAQNGNEPPPYEELYPGGEDSVEETSSVKKVSLMQAAADTIVDQHFETRACTSESAADKDKMEEIQEETQGEIQDVEIGGKVISPEQQKHLREHQAQRMKGLASDRRLYFIWIPLLLLVICAWLRNFIPGIWQGSPSGHELMKPHHVQSLHGT